jgi:hypothetical protein
MTDLVTAYLAQLDTELAPLPPDERVEIAAGVRDHIAERLAQLGPDPTPAAVADLLEAVGEAADFVPLASPQGDDGGPHLPPTPPVPAAPPAPRVSGASVVAAVVAFLGIALAAIPVVGIAIAGSLLGLAITGLRRAPGHGESRTPWIVAIVGAAIALAAAISATAGFFGLLAWDEPTTYVGEPVIVGD